jgi:Family of unknown function (DUF6527)
MATHEPPRVTSFMRGRRVVGQARLKQAGDFGYLTEGEKVVGLVYLCPCGCGRRGAILFGSRSRSTGAAWTWDGNLESPTLTPAIERRTPCTWRGDLTDGMWRRTR